MSASRGPPTRRSCMAMAIEKRGWSCFWPLKMKRPAFAARRLRNMAMARGDSGILCSRAAFMRSGGTIQIFSLGLTSSQVAPRTSTDLAAVRTQNSSAMAPTESCCRSCAMKPDILHRLVSSIEITPPHRSDLVEVDVEYGDLQGIARSLGVVGRNDPEKIRAAVQFDRIGLAAARRQCESLVFE